MILIKTTAHLQASLQHYSNTGTSIGFVPTMGALHSGHLSLLAASGAANQLNVVSIFVNPAQFNDKKDFEKYPVTIEKDIEMLAGAGCDLLFLPPVEEMYPQELPTQQYDLGRLESVFEGKYRPGHFQGVCRVMHRLMDLVQPAHLYMGQKDYQQCMVVSRLLELIHSPAQLHTCPTLREADGLAMSSRNMRLSPAARERAPAIYNTLQFLKNNVQAGNTQPTITTGIAMLETKHFRVDYLAIANAITLEPLDFWDGKTPLVALAAAFLDEVRLIDNMLLNT